MEIFALDVGSGTQDVLVIDDKLKDFKAKVVMPAPTRLFASGIRKAGKDIFCDGYTMGGGAISMALVNHAKKFRVVMTEDAARTVRDDLEQVKERGIEIGAEADMREDYSKFTLRDVDMDSFRSSFKAMNYELPGPRDLVVAVAVQDHGSAPKGMSDREFRFEQIAGIIKKGATFRDFIITRETPVFTRASAVIRSLHDQGYHNVLVMDTKIAGIFGGMYGAKLPAIVMDVGNGHTTAASITEDGSIVGIFEHHTFSLTPNKMKDYIERLANATLTNEEIFNDGGHGAYVREPISPESIIVTGPRRMQAEETGLNIRYATPLEDVYMVGPVGMVRAYQDMKGI
ncbi:DUF1786 domain-containing protein [Methanooceanicella nereidis]|nr:DUF1786 domain-containing protein [Methanocella sp. CWC-04]